jgi:tellurite resistance protein
MPAGVTVSGGTVNIFTTLACLLDAQCSADAPRAQMEGLFSALSGATLSDLLGSSVALQTFTHDMLQEVLVQEVLSFDADPEAVQNAMHYQV